MKNLMGLIILAAICLGLGITTIFVKRKATEQHKEDAAKILNLSNQWVTATKNWEEQKQISAMRDENLKKAAIAYAELSNHLTQVSGTLDKTAASLKVTETRLSSTETELKQRDQKIAELESTNQALDKQAAELSTSITNLTVQIAETKRRLEASEGDKAFLEVELKRLVSEKTELERQFNDLVIVRAQVAKLKEELNIARRVEWIRRGLFASPEGKGSAKLMQSQALVPTIRPRENYDLNVEVSTDAPPRILPPPTNSPSAKN